MKAILIVTIALWSISAKTTPIEGEQSDDTLGECYNTLQQCHIFAINCKEIVDLQQERIKNFEEEIKAHDGSFPWWAWVLVGAAGTLGAAKLIR